MEEYLHHTENTVQKPPEDVRKPLLIEVNGRLAPLENIRVVKINGRTRVLVIGREYEFTLKSGCVPLPNEETPKGTGCEPKRKMPKTNSKTSKRRPAAE